MELHDVSMEKITFAANLTSAPFSPLKIDLYGIEDTSSRSGNDAHADDAYITPIYDEEPMAKVQTTAKINVFTIGQQHTEQPEFNNEGEVDQNADQCHDKCPLPAKLIDNQKTELSYQSLKFENICLKKTVAQFQKDFLRMEAHCVNLELKYQNQALKEGQHGQFLKVTSNEAKVKHDIDVIETINIELEHKVAKLLEENETLKRHNKEMFDSIKTIRAKNIEHTASLIANNDKFKAQLQEKGFAIAALKMRKPALQPRRNQSVVRQPTAFKSERPSLSKQRFASQVDVNNDLSKPVTTHYLPKERESAVAKPHHMIAPGSSRYSSNDMVHNHYLEEAKKKTQESSRNSEPSVMPSARSQSTKCSKPKPHVDSEPKMSFHILKDITNQYECEQTLDVSAGTLNLSAAMTSVHNSSGLAPPRQMTSDHNSSELGIHDHSNELSSSKLVPKVVPLADKTATSRQELELLFHHHITMLRNKLVSTGKKRVCDSMWNNLFQANELTLNQKIVTNLFTLTVLSALRCSGSYRWRIRDAYSSWSRNSLPYAHAPKLQRNTINSIMIQDHEAQE
ncbi:hypothetical protein Tco_1291465 [Tanacetum coccineum]